MKPWDEEAFDLDGQKWEALWDEVLPSDFVFAVVKVGKRVEAVAVTPESVFEKEGYAFDQSLRIDDLLPSGWTELSEGEYEPEEPVNARSAIQIFRDAGFKFSEKFQDFTDEVQEG